MKNSIVYLLIIILLGCKANSNQTTFNKEKFEPNWASLQKYEVPEWWLNTKFGIYFHWGVYSVPAHETEWYSIWMYNKEHPIHQYHLDTYGDLKEFGYKDFVPKFTGENFDADEWVALFKKAGAQFAGPVAEHADGFAMWDSQLTEWDAMDKGPKRDIVGEMEKAVRKAGMKFILTYHRHWLWAWFPTWDETTDAYDPQYAGLYGPKTPKGTFVMANEQTNPLPDKAFNEEWLARLNELMDKYQPDILWFDNKMDIIDETYRQRFLSTFYNNAQEWNREVVCTYKFEDLPKGTAVLDLERSRMSKKQDFPWLTDDSIDWKAWCDISNPNYKSTNRLIDFLVDVVSKNGAVLLNITPTAKGEIPEPVKERLLEMGEWLAINGEAIYGTRPWKVYGEGSLKITEGHLSEDKNPEATAEDVRFTTNDGNLYATFLDFPQQNMLIRALAKKEGLLNKNIDKISLLGSKETIRWELTEAGLVIEQPKEKPCEHAFVFKIELEK